MLSLDELLHDAFQCLYLQEFKFEYVTWLVKYTVYKQEVWISFEYEFTL